MNVGTDNEFMVVCNVHEGLRIMQLTVILNF